MIRNKDELLATLSGLIGEDTSDKSLAIIEDFTDSITDYETRLADSTDWKAKYEENDASWRSRYKERFFNGDTTADTTADTEPESEPKVEPKTFEDLFE